MKSPTHIVFTDKWLRENIGGCKPLYTVHQTRTAKGFMRKDGWYRHHTSVRTGYLKNSIYAMLIPYHGRYGSCLLICHNHPEKKICVLVEYWKKEGID